MDAYIASILYMKSENDEVKVCRALDEMFEESNKKLLMIA